jgi:hypothetical protein
MAQFKVVVQYTQTDSGFAEQYYREAADLAAASVFPTTLINAMIQTKCGPTVLRKIRVSNVANNRESVVIPVNRPSPFTTLNPDVVSTAAIVTLNSPSIGAKRQLWIRGLVDSDVQRAVGSGLDQPHASLLGEISALITRLNENQFRVRALTKINPPGVVYTDIAKIVSVEGAGEVTIRMAAPYVLPSPARVIITQVDPKLFPGLNGHWTIQFVDTLNFKIRYRPHVFGTFDLAKGRWRPEAYVYGAIDPATSGFSNFGSRDTGKSPLAGRGRRSALLIRSR